MPWKKLDFGKPTGDERKRIIGRARFYADYNVDETVIWMLRNLGYDVQTAGELGFESATDEAHFKRAFDSGRILLSIDKDFLNEQRFPYSQTRGVVVLNIDTSSPKEIAHALDVLHFVLGPIARVLAECKIIVNSDHTFSITTREPMFPGWITRKNRYRVDAEFAYIWEE
jgi:predicted nuclease of predicted toxin-antitoxin system